MARLHFEGFPGFGGSPHPLLPAPLPSRQQRVAEALFGTLPGRAIVVGLAIKLLVGVLDMTTGAAPAFLSVVDTVAGLAIAAGALYFVFLLLVLAKRRLLWRVRRKLILSYIFMGFVPAILIVVFFLLCGLLLFYNFSSYLVQSRLEAIEDQGRLVAESTAVEIQRASGRDTSGIIARRQENTDRDFPGASIVILPVNRPCARIGVVPPDGVAAAPASPPVTAGPWRHVEPPRALPPWIDCRGFSGLLAYSHATGAAPPSEMPRTSTAATGQGAGLLEPAEDTHMFVRAAAFPDSATPGYAVIVDLLVNDNVKQRLRSDTGVEVKSVSVVEIADRREAKPIEGREGGDSAASRSAGTQTTGPLNWVTFLEYRDWDTGKPGTLLVSTQLSIAEIYDRIASGHGLIGNRSFGQALLLVLLVVVGGLFLVIEGVALVVGLALAKSITGSVHELFAGTERVRQGDFTHKIAVKAHDQLGELAESFNSMTASIEDLLRQAAEKKRLEEELRIAREIQMSLLPQGPLLMSGLSVTALCVPAREVGGDYYDFFRIDDERLGVLIADVSGKGTSAALYMAELKGLVLSLSQIHTSPRELMITANRIITDNLDARSFITMTYAIVDLRARTLTYARAGHTPLMFLPGPGCEGSHRVQVLAPDGLVLGLKIDKGEMFERLLVEETMVLHPGDLYLLFTDGITEAMNAGDDCFGEVRLGHLIEEHGHLPSDELRERVLREVQAFVGDAPQHDDITLVLLKIDKRAAGGTTINAVDAELAEQTS